MHSASVIVLSGCSAGGLGIYLGVDQLASLIHRANPRIIVRGLADSGFFLDYSSSYRTPVTHMPYGKDEASVGGLLNYGGAMRQVFSFTNMSSGTHPACLAAHLHNPSNCVFAEHVVRFIRTPTFAFQVRSNYLAYNVMDFVTLCLAAAIRSVANSACDWEKFSDFDCECLWCTTSPSSSSGVPLPRRQR